MDGITRRRSRSRWASSAVTAATVLLAACMVGETAGPDGGGIATYDPAWITASWSGGAKGAPNDRIDRTPSSFQGRLCPAGSVHLTNHGGEFAGLHIANLCTIPVTYALCATKGSGPQPQFGLDECADDPLMTPFSRLMFIPLNPGTAGFYVNATQALSIQIFYCSDATSLTASPARCLGA